MHYARSIAVLALIALAGCSTISALQHERETRYMPEAVNPPATRGIFVTEYAAAQAAAIADPSTANIVRMVDSGSAVSAISCGSWMRKDVLLAQGVIMHDSTAAAVGAATTIAAGAFSLNPGAVAGVGLAQMVAHLFGQVEKTGLGAPDAFQAQSTMRATLGKCSSALTEQAKAGNLTLAQAVIGIDACEWLCTPNAATAISTQALAQTEVAVTPGGGISVVAVGSSFQKDDSSARIIGYWMQGGVVNPINDAQLKVWMKAHGIETSVPFLAHSKLYEAARRQAVADLNLPEAR